MSTPTLDPTTATPAEVDAVLFPLWKRIDREQAILKEYTHKRTRLGRRTIQKPKTSVELAQLHPHERRQMDLCRGRLQAAQDQAAPLEDEFTRRGGWTRVYLVTNADGHVHSTTACPTCHPTTQFAMVPELSGLDDDQIVEQVGASACTVCYPKAPTHPAWARSQREADEARQARQADKQAVQDAKAAKQAAAAIAHPDGQPLTDWTGYDKITTLRQARIELADLAEERLGGWGTPDNAEARAHAERRIAEAVAHKEGKTIDQVIGEAEQRARKRR